MAKKGDYLGGVRTVEDIMQRCWIDPDTGCWVWRLSMNGGSPKVHFVAPDTGDRKEMRGRRAVLYLERGHDLPAGHQAFPASCCKDDRCMNPAHARSGTLKQQREALVRSGRIKDNPRMIAANRMNMRSRAKLTPADVVAIRQSTESHHELARRYGVAQFTIWRVKAGVGWKDVAPVAASVFTAAAILTASGSKS